MQKSINDAGFTYLSLLFAIFIIGLTLSSVGKQWTMLDKKDKEEELLFRGDQFVKAIGSYFKSAHGSVNLYPKKLEDLVKDPRGISPKRYLRKIYKDPFTGKSDWILILDEKSGRIKGIKSRSTGSPIKEDQFSAPYENFKGKKSYTEWEFIYTPKNTTKSSPGKIKEPAKSLF